MMPMGGCRCMNKRIRISGQATDDAYVRLQVYLAMALLSPNTHYYL